MRHQHVIKNTIQEMLELCYANVGNGNKKAKTA